MKRILVLGVAGLVVVVAVAGLAGAAGSPSSGLDRRAAAQKILDLHGRFLSGGAQTALRMIATDSRQLMSTEEQDAAPGRRKAHGVARSGGTGPGAPAFSNVRVNNPALDTGQLDQTTQSETTVTVAGSNIAVGYNDSQHTGLFLTAASDLSGYAYSNNGGASFKDGGVIPNMPEFINFGDPWLTSDRAGNMYYANLALDAVNQNLDVAVARSADGGKTWSTATPVSRPPFEIFYSGDKDAIAAGPDPGVPSRDNLYVAYDDFSFDLTTGAFLIGLPVARSIDHGATWQVHYADRFDGNAFAGCSFAQYIGAVPAVASDGTLYVAAEKISADDPDCLGNAATFSEWIFKSSDGGQTFGPGAKIADVTPSVPGEVLELGPGQYMRNLEFPTIATVGSAVYVAWNDGASGHSHIKLAKSTNAGQTWSISAVTSGSNDELQPSATGDSALHLVYYRRNGDNTLDVYVANSANGTGFSTKRVTTESSPGVFTNPQFDPIIALTYMGDYIGSATDGSRQYFAWGDNRDVVTNSFWEQGRHDPDVFFAKQ